MSAGFSWFTRLAMEPPFRILTRSIVKALPVSVFTRDFWEVSARPNYLMGVLTAAGVAAKSEQPAITVIEFGVAGGAGLLALEREAEAVEKETGIQIEVFGFDNGPGGLPTFIGDFRDHPDVWQPGDYPMDVERLRSRLDKRTELILGNVSQTVPAFVEKRLKSPIGFVAFDLDLYSSTRDALALFRHPRRRMLRQTGLYFDDIEPLVSHRFAGELLAIEEFNSQSTEVKIDCWYQASVGRPFPERSYWNKMYIAHDLEAISNTVLRRPSGHLRLSSKSR